MPLSPSSQLPQDLDEKHPRVEGGPGEREQEPRGDPVERIPRVEREHSADEHRQELQDGERRPQHLVAQVPVGVLEADDARAPVQGHHDHGERERHAAERHVADAGDQSGGSDDDDEQQGRDGRACPRRHALDRDDGRDVHRHGDDDEAGKRGAGADRGNEEALPGVETHWLASASSEFRMRSGRE
ncbi:hypothetical protein ACFPRL_05370 [Pseudoclavibacter helvolus]